MKLYLSSYRVPTPKDLKNLLGKPFKECRVAIIPNAKDYNPAEERSQKINELAAYIANLGLRVDIIDLRDYDESQQLSDKLKAYELIWAAGGNTYVLRQEMQRSGFDLSIKDLLAHGCIYGGESAGAIVAGASLRGFEVADDPALAEKTIWEGLGLTDKIIAPHMDNSDFHEYTEHIKKLYAGDENIVYLNDNQAFLVNGASQRVVSS